MPSNLSAHTDTQQQIAAARRLLGAGSLKRYAFESDMRILARTCLTAVLLSAAFYANAFKPVELGLQPVYQQIRDVQKQIYSLAGEFATNASVQFVRDELGHRIVQLMATRKALEVEVERATALSHSSLINFVTSREAAK